MELAFGIVGFFLAQAGIFGLFSLAVAPWMALACMALGLAFIGMAFSRWRYRLEFALASGAALVALGTVAWITRQPWWFTVLEYLLAVAALGMGLRMGWPALWDGLWHPTRLVELRLRRRTAARR